MLPPIPAVYIDPPTTGRYGDSLIPCADPISLVDPSVEEALAISVVEPIGPVHRWVGKSKAQNQSHRERTGQAD
jgi:hypothetical protein